MSECLFQDCHRIPTARATWHDYNAGEYFITICTQDREHYFGEIADGKMNFTKLGLFANEQFSNVHNHYSYAEIPLWVVMPNHIHAIVIINRKNIPYEKRNVETFHETSLHKRTPIQIATEMQSWLSVVVRQLKQSITRFAKKNSISFAWQSRFHDHIIRNNDDRNAIADYIENNVVKWELDKFYG